GKEVEAEFIELTCDFKEKEYQMSPKFDEESENENETLLNEEIKRIEEILMMGT
ncbi:hypothetical protein KI387_023714, partial [Taxus chinensis]